MAQQKTRKIKVKMPPVPRSDELPVTQSMLYLVRDELRSRLTSVEHGQKGLAKGMQTFEHRIDAKLNNMAADIHGIKLLIEEQTHRNTIVLDGLRSLFERQERIERRLADIEK